MPGPLVSTWEQRLSADGLALVGATEGAPRAVDRAFGRSMRAEFWRQAAQAASTLPYGWPRGRFVRLAVELGNVARAARECDLSHRASRWAWRRFLVFAGLPAPLVKGSQGRKRPTKPGQVRIEAGRFREERAA